NVVRVTATVLLAGPDADRPTYDRFHEMAGWLMMALALAVLWAELAVLRLVIVEEPRAAQSAEREAQGVDLSAPRAPRLVLCVLALVVVALHGLVHACCSDRWSLSGELQASAERLAAVPMAVGEWDGTA